ncbi:MAG: glycosyltransferase [Chitinophagaceae bacterium]|nr:MAG: glycosyltransferase [Chitinophagaceae bacterium]
MKILHITSSIDPKAGGVSQALRSMIRGLSAASVVNDVVSLDDPDSGVNEGDSFTAFLLGPPKTSWRYTKNLIPWLKENIANYDIVLIHGLWQYHSYAAHKVVTALRGKKPRLMVMPHGMLDPYFQKAEGRRLKALRNNVYWKLLEGRVVNDADKLLFTAQTEQDVSALAFTPYKIKSASVVGLGIETPPAWNDLMADAFLQQSGYQLPQNYLLFLGRINEKKGVDLLVDAWLHLKTKYPSFPGLMIAGPGLDSVTGEAVTAKLNGVKDAWLPGMLRGNAKWAAFYGAGAFVLPSHQENFGISVVESMLCHKAVLISNKVNISQEIAEGGGGLVENDDLPGTITLLERWHKLTNAEKSLMNRTACRVANELYSVENATARLMSAIGYGATQQV